MEYSPILDSNLVRLFVFVDHLRVWHLWYNLTYFVISIVDQKVCYLYLMYVGIISNKHCTKALGKIYFKFLYSLYM